MATERIGMTSSGKLENCTIPATQKCQRHPDHLDGVVLPQKPFLAPIEVDDELEEVGNVTFDQYMNPVPKTIREAVEEMNNIANEMARTWEETLDKVTAIHDETTEKLAALRSMTVQEYEFWLANLDVSREHGLWVDADEDEHGYIKKAKWISPNQDTIVIETTNVGGAYTTKFTRFIGDSKFKTIDVGQPFKMDDSEHVKTFIEENLL